MRLLGGEKGGQYSGSRNLVISFLINKAVLSDLVV